MSISKTFRSLFGQRDTICPSEAEVLAFAESRLSARSRVHLERHFAGCDDCRELLVFLGRESAEMHGALPDEAVRQQANKVLSLIQSDEINRKTPEYARRRVRPFHVSYPKIAAAALMLGAIAISAIMLFSGGQKPTEAAMEALKLAVKDRRFTEARVSGGFGYSRYSQMRGDESNDDLQFSRAISKLRFAEQETAPISDRLALARVYLARGTRDDATHALTILDQLVTRGVETPEAFNDTGVAQFELTNYEDAIVYFTRALAESPGYSEALFNKALAEERAHHNEQAKQDWEHFVFQSSDDSWKSEARMHLSFLTGAK